MKRSFIIIGVLLLGSLAVAQTKQAVFLAEGNKTLTQIDSQLAFGDSDFSAEYTIVTNTPGEGQRIQVAALFRRDRENKYLIIILQPEVDKGKGYLKVDNNLWYYDPVEGRSNVTSAKDRFQNSNVRNSDFSRSNLAGEYGITAVRTEKLGNLDCRVLELLAKVEGVTYPQRRLWISTDNLVRKIEDYSLSHQLLRTTAIPSYLQLGQKFVPAQMVMIDELKGKKINGTFVKERTQVTVAKPSTAKIAGIQFVQSDLQYFSKK